MRVPESKGFIQLVQINIVCIGGSKSVFPPLSHSLLETETALKKKRVEILISAALWAPKTRKFPPTEFLDFCERYFPLPTYRNSPKFCRWFDTFSSPQKKVNNALPVTIGRSGL